MLVPLLLGLIGSLHCVGMCGPIAMMLPLKKSSFPVSEKAVGQQVHPFLGALIYNLGRVTTYAFFGLVFGMIGKSFEWFGWQQNLSIGLGVLILIALLLPGVMKKTSRFSAAIDLFMGRIRQRLSKLMFNGHPGSLYGIGLLNGILPCGMVYVAIAGAVATGDPFTGSAFMALFGLGTLPAMWTISFFGTLIKPSVRLRARKLFPAMMAVMAMLLILRGMNLDIPYLSPALHLSHSTPIECHD